MDEFISGLAESDGLTQDGPAMSGRRGQCHIVRVFSIWFTITARSGTNPGHAESIFSADVLEEFRAKDNPEGFTGRILPPRHS